MSNRRSINNHTEHVNLWTLARVELQCKAVWHEGDCVELWRNKDGTERAVLKRSGAYVSIYIYYGDHELTDAFSVGVIADESNRVVGFLLNGLDQYKAWTERVTQYLTSRRKISSRRRRDAEAVNNALWVNGKR